MLSRTNNNSLVLLNKIRINIMENMHKKTAAYYWLPFLNG
ncbi:hypothetical protein CJA_0403 [Cellvibrio japonicus Ueda107]|uniref:Uncharacterized protein n=1 Tax=Cellvibrio japonicus (strain Ueda107) TaxID=498211 RepID=B3PI64_CELJU|nr:hypothetical protein CJA_0403 [Cellvibrio japonicus Ueda107]